MAAVATEVVGILKRWDKVQTAVVTANNSIIVMHIPPKGIDEVVRGYVVA